MNRPANCLESLIKDKLIVRLKILNFDFKMSPILQEKKTKTKTKVKNSALENNLS